jgi:hypothetical protein
MRVVAFAFVVLAAFATFTSADILAYPAALTFERGYAIGPSPPFPYQTLHALGSPLNVYGRVVDVSAVFEDLLPPGAFELTYVFEGSTCDEVGNFDGPCSGGEYAFFHGGTLTVYLDNTPDFNFTDASTFRDGDVVLAAALSSILVGVNDPHELCPWMPDGPDVRSYFRFVGGNWFDRVNNHGDGFTGFGNGELYNDVPPDLKALGYVCGIDGIVDIYAPVSVNATTWGAVKALYR